MKFLIDKKIRYAVAGKVPIQVGRNVLVEGNIAMVAPQRMPPLIALSDSRIEPPPDCLSPGILFHVLWNRRIPAAVPPRDRSTDKSGA